MNRLRNQLIVIAFIAVLAFLGMLVRSSRAGAQNSRPPTPVDLVNPLPVPVTGTMGFSAGSTVNIANTASSPVLARDVGPIE
jgi:hypothetical protein